MGTKFGSLAYTRSKKRYVVSGVIKGGTKLNRGNVRILSAVSAVMECLQAGKNAVLYDRQTGMRIKFDYMGDDISVVYKEVNNNEEE